MEEEKGTKMSELQVLRVRGYRMEGCVVSKTPIFLGHLFHSYLGFQRGPDSQMATCLKPE